MSWTNEDVRDEIYEQDEEEDEGPSWVDDKGKILEAAFCEYFLKKHPLMCLKQTLFDLNGEVDEDKLIYEIHQEIRYHARNDVAKKVKRLVEALKIEAYREEWKPQLDRIHLKNGTYYLEERGFVLDKGVHPKFCVKSNECRNGAKFICRRQRQDRLPPMSTT